MGGRGASSGISEDGKKYGTEFSTIAENGNIKFIRYNDSASAKTPMETMTKGRVYAIVNSDNNVSAITYYDNNGKRVKTIDLRHFHKGMKPHTHHGYEHHENDGPKGAAKVTAEEKRMVARVQRLWHNYINR